MENKFEIVRDKESEQVYLSLLNNHFKTITYEKYIDAMMNVIFTEVKDKVLGKKFNKKRISRKKGTKIKEGVSEKLKHKYGKWVGMSQFKIKDVNTILFHTNLDKVFKVPGYGTLYGAYYKSVCGNIFFTSHSLTRFEERTDLDTTKALSIMFKSQFKTEPTSIDIICGLIFTCEFIYGRFSCSAKSGDSIHARETIQRESDDDEEGSWGGAADRRWDNVPFLFLRHP